MTSYTHTQPDEGAAHNLLTHAIERAASLAYLIDRLADDIRVDDVELISAVQLAKREARALAEMVDQVDDLWVGNAPVPAKAA